MAKNNFDKADNLHLKYENFVLNYQSILRSDGVPKEEFSHISKSMMDIFDQIKETRPKDILVICFLKRVSQVC